MGAQREEGEKEMKSKAIEITSKAIEGRMRRSETRERSRV